MIYLDGRILPESEALIPVTDRGLQLGDGVFTTAKVVDGSIIRWERHHQRLVSQCEALCIVPPSVTHRQMQDYVAQAGASSGTWRLKVVITAAGNGLCLTSRPAAHVIASLTQYTAPSGPARLYPIEAPMVGPLTKIKTLCYLHRLYLFQAAQDAGYDDVATVTSDGTLIETAFSNLFWIAGKTIYSPSSDLPLLDGIALSETLDEHQSRGYTVERGHWNVDRLCSDARIFTCNALHTRPVSAIGTREFTHTS